MKDFALGFTEIWRGDLIACFVWLAFIFLSRTVTFCQMGSSVPWWIGWGRPNCSNLRHDCQWALHSSVSCTSPVWDVRAPGVDNNSCSESDLSLTVSTSCSQQWPNARIDGMAPGCCSSYSRRNKFSLACKVQLQPGGKELSSFRPHCRLRCAREGQKVPWDVLF